MLNRSAAATTVSCRPDHTTAWCVSGSMPTSRSPGSCSSVSGKVGPDGRHVEDEDRRAAGLNGLERPLQRRVQPVQLHVRAVCQRGADALQEQRIAIKNDLPRSCGHDTRIAGTEGAVTVGSDKKTIVRISLQTIAFDRQEDGQELRSAHVTCSLHDRSPGMKFSVVLGF